MLTASPRPAGTDFQATLGIESIKSLIRQPANPPERMTRRDPLLNRDIGEQGIAALLLASHQRLDSCPIVAGGAGLFSELLDLCPGDRRR